MHKQGPNTQHTPGHEDSPGHLLKLGYPHMSLASPASGPLHFPLLHILPPDPHTAPFLTSFRSLLKDWPLRNQLNSSPEHAVQNSCPAITS